MVLTPAEKEARKKKRIERGLTGRAAGDVPDKKPTAKGGRYTMGGMELSKEEYRAAAGTLGFKGGGGEITPKAKEALAAHKERVSKILTPEQEKLAKQQEILEREKLGREPVVEEEQISKQPILYYDEAGNPVYSSTHVPTIEPTEEQITEGRKAIIGGTVALGMMMIPEGRAGKAAVGAAKVATSAKALKVWNGLRTTLKNKFFQKAFGYGVVGYTYLTERKIGNIDSALSQVRESITIPVSIAAANPMKIGDSWDMIEDLEEDVNEYESMLKLKIITTSPILKFTGRLMPIFQRVKKLRTAIELARDQISKVEAEQRVFTDEETAFMLAEINDVLNQMEDPSKFLGIF